MKLFGKENDLIKRILNLILVVWLIATIVITFTNVVDLMFDYSLEKYEDYKVLYCVEQEEDACLEKYNFEKVNNKMSKTSQVKELINSGGNFIVVSTFIFFINKNKSEK